MLNMAQRPYSSVILESTVENHPESRMQTVSKIKSISGKKDVNIVPVAIETTSNNLAAICTVFVKLPGHKRTSVCLGSSLIVQPKNNIFLNKPPPRISQQVVWIYFIVLTLKNLYKYWIFVVSKMKRKKLKPSFWIFLQVRELPCSFQYFRFSSRDLSNARSSYQSELGLPKIINFLFCFFICFAVVQRKCR